MKRIFINALIDIETNAPAGVPYPLAQGAVNRARELGLTGRRRKGLNSFEEGDQVWAVFDRDEHPRYSEAVGLCEGVGVRVGRSDPCFELWLVLHEEDFDRPASRHEVQARLKVLRPEYDPSKGKTPDCADLIKRVDEAERRAEAQLERRANERNAYGNPSSTVCHLTKAIRDAAERAC